jgi:hypothetical protein
VDKILSDCDISYDRILALTSDNATNNKTLTKAINEALNALTAKLYSSPHTTITRIPCLAHVIQLSVRALLDSLQLSPKNDEERKYWDETKADLPPTPPANQAGPIWTLKKVNLCLI